MTELVLVDVMNAVIARLDRINTRLDQMDVGINALQICLNILQAKQDNSMKGRKEPQKKILKPDGSQPVSEYPLIEQLLVSRPEILSSGRQNTWSAYKCLLLIREYKPILWTEMIKIKYELVPVALRLPSF